MALLTPFHYSPNQFVIDKFKLKLKPLYFEDFYIYTHSHKWWGLILIMYRILKRNVYIYLHCTGAHVHIYAYVCTHKIKSNLVRIHELNCIFIEKCVSLLLLASLFRLLTGLLAGWLACLNIVRTFDCDLIRLASMLITVHYMCIYGELMSISLVL